MGSKTREAFTPGITEEDGWFSEYGALIIIVVVVLLLCFAVYYYCRCRKRKRRKKPPVVVIEKRDKDALYKATEHMMMAKSLIRKNNRRDAFNKFKAAKMRMLSKI